MINKNMNNQCEKKKYRNNSTNVISDVLDKRKNQK